MMLAMACLAERFFARKRVDFLSPKRGLSCGFAIGDSRLVLAAAFVTSVCLPALSNRWLATCDGRPADRANRFHYDAWSALMFAAS